MQIAVVLVFILATASATTAPTAAPTAMSAAASSDEGPARLFEQFGLFGQWAGNCGAAASSANPHVDVSEPAPGVILEEHHLGDDYAVNRYSVLGAEKLSDTELSVVVVFNPGAADEERQRLIFAVHDGTRRTMFNQADDGPALVKDGIALKRGTKTPLLHKCN
jgi:hypothetical protein